MKFLVIHPWEGPSCACRADAGRRGPATRHHSPRVAPHPLAACPSSLIATSSTARVCPLGPEALVTRDVPLMRPLTQLCLSSKPLSKSFGTRPIQWFPRMSCLQLLITRMGNPSRKVVAHLCAIFWLPHLIACLLTPPWCHCSGRLGGVQEGPRLYVPSKLCALLLGGHLVETTRRFHRSAAHVLNSMGRIPTTAFSSGRPEGDTALRRVEEKRSAHVQRSCGTAQKLSLAFVDNPGRSNAQHLPVAHRTGCSSSR